MSMFTASNISSGSVLLDFLQVLDTPGAGVLVGIFAAIYLIGRFCSQCPLRQRYMNEDAKKR